MPMRRLLFGLIVGVAAQLAMAAGPTFGQEVPAPAPPTQPPAKGAPDVGHDDVG